MAEEGALGGSRSEIVERFTRIPGLGRSRAEAMYDAGYTNIGLLRKASVDELTRIPGIGISLARCVKNNLDGVRDDEPGPASPAEAPGAPAAEPAKIVVGEQPPADKRPDAPEAAAPAAGAKPPQRGFLSSVFDKILGKPAPAQPSGEKKGPEKKEPEKKDADTKEPARDEGVKVETTPAPRAEEKKEPDKNEPEKKEAAKEEPPLPPPPAPPAPEAKPAGAKQEKM
jgi:hypothetical protein